jgi:methyl-accepting chemotaxis protein
MNQPAAAIANAGTWMGGRLGRLGGLAVLRRWRHLLPRAAEWWASGDIPGFRDMGIQQRFNLLIGVALAAGVLAGGAYAVGEARISAAMTEGAQFQAMGEQAGNIRAGALAMQTAANGLIAERQRHFIEDFDAQLAQLAKAMDLVKAVPQAADHQDEINRLDGATTELAGQFKAVSGLTLTLGLTESDGLRGRLGASAKAIEAELAMWPGVDDLKTRLLRMRQAEKDFMLYQDDGALGRHRKYANEFDLGIDVAAIGPATKDDFRALAATYTKDMAAYGTAYLEQQAEINKLRASFAALQPRIRDFAAMARDGAAQAAARQMDTRSQVGLITALMGLLSLLAVLVVGLVSGRSIARPVLAMGQAMNRLAAGETGIEIPGTHRADEVGLMAKAVQVFRDNALAVESLRIRQQAEQAAKELRARKLDALIAEFDGHVGQIIGAVAGQAVQSQDTARDVDSFVTQTLERMRSVDQSSAAATDNVQAMAAAAEQLACSVAEISARCNDASGLAAQAADAAQRTDGVVGTLFEVTQKIDTVVTFIQTIASQTRLLALNATIEAARAGEHGHGFTVVANEVKQLASQTTHATQEIAQQIAAVQSAGREAGAAIREIAQAVTKVNGITASIAAAVEEQGAATGEIARSAQEAAQGSTQVASSISWVVAEAQDMQSAAARMLDTAGQMTGRSEELRVTVDNFLLGVHDGEVSLKWGDNWLTGNAEIDADHKALVGYVNELGQAMSEGHGREIIARTLDQLTQYTVGHFAREEAIWTLGGLPSLAAHRRLHADLVAKVASFQKDFAEGRAQLTMEMMAFLREWLIDHVLKSDKAAVKALAERA